MVVLRNGIVYRIQHTACAECEGVYVPVEALATRPVKLGPEVQEVGIECPHCGHFIHRYYTTPDLRLLKQIVDGLAEEWERRDEDLAVGRRLSEARSRYKKRFDEVNEELRAKAGVGPPRDTVEINEKNGQTMYTTRQRKSVSS